MHEEQRGRGGAGAGGVDEVLAAAVQLEGELREGVEGGFLRAPVEVVVPVGGEVAHVGDIGAVGPGLAGGLVGPAGLGEADF